MHAEGASPAFSEYREIAACLRCLDDAERIFLVGDRKINGVVAGDLQEDAGIGAALVGLPCGVQKARTKSEDGRYLLLVSHAVANGLKNNLVLGIHGDVGEESEIIPRAGAAKMSFQHVSECLPILQNVGVLLIGVELDAVGFE